MTAIPKASEPFLDGGGRVARSWLVYLASLSRDAATAALQAQVDQLRADIAGISVPDMTLHADGSIDLDGTLAGGYVVIRLEGDEDSPGASYYYGTDAAGEKGWHALTASAIPYDNTTSGLSAEDAQAAIDELAAASTSSSNFVPMLVADGETYTVPANCQALFAIPVEFGSGAALIADGAFVEVD